MAAQSVGRNWRRTKNALLALSFLVVNFVLSFGVRAEAPSDCVPTGERDAEQLSARIGVPPEQIQAFSPAICRYDLGPRMVIVSYDINRVELSPNSAPGPNPRYPMPLILVDGRMAGRLPTHVPAELPVTIEITSKGGSEDILPILCLHATTDGVGDPPTYLPLVWREGKYRTTSQRQICD